ncbi:MAG TPA: DUF3822 family protein [Chitinophagaceae bacterium]|nr:DUF3822 family protein [Chitinophagaceae bacterium]
MSSELSNHILRRQYTAHKGEDLLSQVHRVICIVTPNSFISAGFHPSGEVLAVNSSQLEPARWDPAFIEHELLNDPLLAAPELIKGVFVAATKNMIIPDELYVDDARAGEWLKHTFHCEHDEKINVQPLDKSEAHTCYSFPSSIQDIFAKYTNGLTILPLNMIHFKNSIAVNNLLQCTLTDCYAIGTLHHHQNLHWHQTFDYHNAEDVAYKLSAACQYFGVDLQSYPINISSTSIEQHPVLKKLQLYIPALQTKKTGISDIISPEWSSAIHLFQQLYSCA